ncbi:unnamed protein product, partial [marine sediment metagenome]
MTEDKICETCDRLIKECDIPGPYDNQRDDYLKNNCENCRRERYSKELITFNWGSWPGHSEGNVLCKILKFITATTGKKY